MDVQLILGSFCWELRTISCLSLTSTDEATISLGFGWKLFGKLAVKDNFTFCCSWMIRCPNEPLENYRKTRILLKLAEGMLAYAILDPGENFMSSIPNITQSVLEKISEKLNLWIKPWNFSYSIKKLISVNFIPFLVIFKYFKDYDYSEFVAWNVSNNQSLFLFGFELRIKSWD